MLAPPSTRGKFDANKRAIELLRELESANRNATPEEKTELAAYSGWGWAGEYFNPNNPRYAKEYAQIEALLTEEEFKSAAGSTLNAHYTAPKVISGMWDAVGRMGFEGGVVLEPAGGIGHFFGLMPEGVRARSELHGVELDALSGRIFTKLYPNADIKVAGFEETKIKNNSVDLAISNVPFGGYTVFDPENPKYRKLLIHDYFFAKALDKVKPGGLVVFVTSDGTLQKFDSKVRAMLAERADLVGAIRLPNTAFTENAGTQVTTDIIVLRKKDGKPYEGAQDWIGVKQIGEGKFTERGETKTGPIIVNEYFVANPEMALGQHALAGTMYSAGDYALVADKGAPPLGERLKAAVGRLPQGVMGAKQTVVQAEDFLPERKAEAGEREGETFYDGASGEFYQIINEKQVEPAWYEKRNHGDAQAVEKPITAKERGQRKMIARDWLKLRETLLRLLEAEGQTGVSGGELTALRAQLNRDYDNYKKRYGTLSKRYHYLEKAAFLEEHPDYALLQSLEVERSTTEERPLTKAEKARGETGRKYRLVYKYEKGDIFRERVKEPLAPPERAETAADAVAISRSFTGGIDPAYVARLLGTSEEKAMARVQAEQRAFRDPESGLWEYSEKYLAGNVRSKLAQARALVEQGDESYLPNVTALEAVQPEMVPITKIAMQLSSRWLDRTILERFVEERLGTAATIEYSLALNSYTVELVSTEKAQPEFGIEKMPVDKILKHALNGDNPVIYNYWKDSDGTQQREKDKVATAAAVNKVVRLNQAFQTWAKTTASTLEAEGGRPEMPLIDYIEQRYNEINNSVVPAQYKGDYLTLPGATKTVYKLPHRMAVVARILNEGSVMMAHGVGSGKTYSLITASYEMKRLKMAKKPLLVVQNSTIGQFAASYRQAYPDARVLVATERDLSKHYRKRFLNRIATGNWDAVIITQSQFNRIDSSPEAVEQYFREKINELEEEIRSLRAAQGKKDPTTKELEKAKKNLETKLKNRMFDARKQVDTGVLNFEAMGIDALFIDEAHEYKKVPIVTRKKGVKGIPSDESNRAINLELKIKHVQKENNGRNVVLATGTPITNSMAEAYVMLRLGTPKVLEDYNIRNFDDFANTFGQTQTKLEFTWRGSWANVTRFNKFVNLPELTAMIRAGFDVKMGNKELGLKVPKMSNGDKPELEISPATDATESINSWILKIAAAYENLDGTGKKDNSWVPIVTMGTGMAGALDPRLIDASLPDDPQSKVNRAVRNILDIYRDESVGVDKKTQMVFADQFLPVNTSKLEGFAGGVEQAIEVLPDESPTADGESAEVSAMSDGEGAEAQAEGDAYKRSRGFNLYHDLRDKLIAGGIPANEIAIIHEYNTDKKRKELFDQMNAGSMRVMIGSTAKMGVGVNAHERLYAMHHLDPPRQMTPAMLEQRDGRIIRQGNTNETVRNIRYGVEQSMDTGIYQLLENKATFIRDALMGRGSQRSSGDEAGEALMSMSEMKARLTGDERIIRKAELDGIVEELDLERVGHEDEISASLRNKRRIESLIKYTEETTIPKRQAAVAWFAENSPPDKLEVQIEDGEILTDRKEIVATLENKIQTIETTLDNKAGITGDFERAELRLYWNGVPVILQVNSKDGEGNRNNGIYVKTPFELSQTDSREMNALHTLYGTNFKTASSALTILKRFAANMTEAEQVEPLRQKIALERGKLAPLEQAINTPWEKQVEWEAASKELAALEADLQSDTQRKGEKRPKALDNENAELREPVGTEVLASQVATDRRGQQLDFTEAFDTPKGGVNRGDLLTENLGLATYLAGRYKATLPTVARDDLIQEARIALLRAAKTYKPESGEFSPYASRVIRNRLNDLYRREPRVERVPMDAPLSEGEAETIGDQMADERVLPAPRAAEEAETREMLWAQLERLPAVPRETIERHLRGESFTEIGAAMGVSKQAAAKRWNSAMKVMRQRLGEAGITRQETGVLASQAAEVDDREINAYIQTHAIPKEKAGEARADLKGTAQLASQAAEKPLKVSGTTGGVDYARSTGTRTSETGAPGDARLTEAQAAAREAFITDSPEAWQRALELSAGRVSRLIPELIKNPTEVSFNIRGALIGSPEEAATLLRALRTPYLETLRVIFLNNKGEVLHSNILSVGNVSSTMASPNMVARELSRYKNEQTTGIILAHNHPSGDPRPSMGDIRVTETFGKVSDLIGIPLIDHVITNGDTIYSFNDDKVLSTAYPKVSLDKRKQKRSRAIYKKMGVARGALQEWEIVEGSVGQILDDPNRVYYFKRKLGEGTFIYYLNRRNRLIEVEQLPDAWEGDPYNEIKSLIFEGVGRSGASAVILATDQQKESYEVVEMHRILKEFSNAAKFDFLDLIAADAASKEGFYSFNDAGIISSQAAVRDNLPVDHLQQLAFLEDWAAARGITLDELIANKAGFEEAAEKWRQAHPQKERMDRDLASRTAGTGRDAISYLMSELNKTVPDSGELEGQAQAEASGERTVGRPDLATPAESGAGRRFVGAVDAARELEGLRQSHAEWEAAARTMLETDREGTKRRLLEVAQDPRFNGLQDAVDVKAAQMLVAEMVEQAVTERDPQVMREAQILTHAYRDARAETARALAAGRDPHQTPAERHKEFLAGVFFEPSRKELKRINKAPKAAEKSRTMDRLRIRLQRAEAGMKAGEENKAEVLRLRRELKALKETPDQSELLTAASDARLKRIEAELAKMGVTLEDIFSGETQVRLVGEAILGNYAGNLDAARKKATAMLGRGEAISDIRKVTGLSMGDLNDLREDFRREYLAKHKAKYIAALKGQAVKAESAEDIEVRTLLQSAPAGLSEAEIERMAMEAMERDMAALGFGIGRRSRSEMAERRKKAGLGKKRKGRKVPKKPKAQSVEGLE